MLLMDRPTSPGLLIRPRPGRLELCGEFIDGKALRVAALFAAGSTAAAAAAVCGPRRAATRLLPPRLEVAVVPAVGRYGWYVDRRAYGPDLYREGRRAVLRTRDGGTLRAHDALRYSFDAALRHLQTTQTELRNATEVVAGDAPLPLESDAAAFADAAAPVDPGDEWLGVLRDHHRPRVEAHAVIATWHTTIFEVRASGRVTYANVPARSLAAFLAQFERGGLDDLLAAYASAPATNRVLRSVADTAQPGLFDRVESGTGLLLPERGGDGRRLAGGGGGSSQRHGKERNEQQPPRPRRLAPKIFVAIAAGVIVLAGLLAAVVYASTSASRGSHTTTTRAPARSASGAAGATQASIEQVLYSGNPSGAAQLSCRRGAACVLQPIGAVEIALQGGHYRYTRRDDMGPICIISGVAKGHEVFIETWDLVPQGTTTIDGIEVPARMTGTLRSETPEVPACLPGSLRTSTFNSPPVKIGSR